jgi:hypothetical protein
MGYDGKITISMPPNRDVAIRLNGQSYNITTLFSLNECEILFDCFRETRDSKKAGVDRAMVSAS